MDKFESSVKVSVGISATVGSTTVVPIVGATATALVGEDAFVALGNGANVGIGDRTVGSGMIASKGVEVGVGVARVPESKASEPPMSSSISATAPMPSSADRLRRVGVNVDSTAIDVG